MYSDDYIEHWAEVFTGNNLYHGHRIVFEVFLQAPEAILQAVLLRRGSQFDDPHLPPQPLLAAQVRVAARADAVAAIREEAARQYAHLPAAARLAGGRLVEPIHPPKPAARSKVGIRNLHEFALR